MPGPTQRFVESQRVQICYWDWGNEGAPVLLLQHGGRDHARSWDRLAEALCGEFHVIAPDLRGHGDSGWTPGGNYSMPDLALDLVRVIETVGSPAHVLGHSYGGSICLLTAGTYPEHFRTLTVLEGTHSLNPPDMEKLGPAILRRWGDRLRSFEGDVARPYPSLEAAAERMKAANPRLPDDFLPHLAEHSVKPFEDGYMWKFDLWVNGRLSLEVRRDELPGFWEAIECPVLLMVGDESASRKRQHPEPERHIRDVRTVLVNGAGHWIHHDQLDVVLEELRGFVGQAG